MKTRTLSSARIIFALLFTLIVVKVVHAGFPYRNYKDGQVLYYRMKGLNDGRQYEAVSKHETKKEKNIYFEEITWISLVSNGKNIDLSGMKDFKQRLSLDKEFKGSMPDIRMIPQKLMKDILGPVFDLMTFYVDLNPRVFQEKIKELEKGKTLTIPYNKPSSWADGHRVLLGEDCIDFRFTLQDAGKDKTLLRAEHIPPEADLKINLPAEWMKIPVSGLGPNNWVQISKTGDKDTPYILSYGYEYFDVHIYIDSKDGKIISANMYNPVERVNRTCRDIKMENNVVKGVLNCSKATPFHTFRSISLELDQTR